MSEEPVSRGASAGLVEYDRFSVIAFASNPVRESIEELRLRLPASGRPIIAPHITLKGTFVDPVDLNQIATRVAATCEAFEPMEVSLGELYDYTNGEHASIGFTVLAPAALADLHRRLVSRLEVLCVPLGGSLEDVDAFHPHLTVVQQISIQSLASARKVADAYDVPRRFRLMEAAVMGRRRGGEWEVLSTATLGSPRLSADPPA
jgi:2'-5' RNA ligase